MLFAGISVHAHVWSVRVYLRVFEPDSHLVSKVFENFQVNL